MRKVIVKDIAPVIYRREDIARMSGHSLGWVDSTARLPNSPFVPVKSPSGKRNIGFTATSVEAFLRGDALTATTAKEGR